MDPARVARAATALSVCSKMLKLLLSTIAAICFATAAQAHLLQAIPFADVGILRDVIEARFPRGAPTISQITCNLVTGVASTGGPCTSGASCNGVADDAPAFKAANTWALANQGNNQVVLTIPAGSTCFFGSNQAYSGSPGNAWTSNIKNLIVEGTGASISSIGGNAFYMGGLWGCQAGLASPSGCSARVQTINPGDSTIALTAASFSAGYISRFAVGKLVMVGGLDVQGVFDAGYGYPPNDTYFEWRRITAVCNNTGPCAGGATITLDAPLTLSFLSTWPSYNSGSTLPSEADAGGAATVWAMPDSWDITQEFRGLTISQTGQINGAGRNITYRNVFFPGASGNCGAFPSQAETWTAINTNWDQCVIEADKLVGTTTFTGVTIKQLDWQSNSMTRFVMSNSTVTTMFGAARDSQVTDTSFGTLRHGSYNYGNSLKFVCTRCNVTTYQSFPSGGVSSNIAPPSAGPAPYNMSGGIITWPVSLATAARSPQNWSSPIGVPIFFKTSGGGTNNYSSMGVFSVTSISGGIWPAPDNQSSTTNVTISNGSNNLGVSSNIFSSGDVGKVILIPNARSGGLTLRTYITEFTDAQNVVLYDAATASLAASSQTVQWGTAYVNVQTNQAGGFPNLASLGNSYIQFASSQAPQFTCDACTGDPILTAMNVQSGATPLAPIGTYSKRTYTSQSGGNSIGNVTGEGKLIGLTVDVTQAYTGSGAGTLLPTDQFHNYTVKQSNWTQYDWLPSINAKQAGRRVITPAGVTCDTGGGPVAGGCAGDSNMTVPEAIWIPAGIRPSLSLSGTGGVNPSFTITLETDQTP